MKSGDRRYTVQWISAGQPRAYADSIYKFRILVEWIPYSNNPEKNWEPNDLSETMFDKAAQGLAHGWVPKDQGDWASARLTNKVKVSPGLWEYTVVEAFTD